ncbi:MAG TPA: alpha/beta fold hydrolase [Solirubrobacteraceae bacterium]|nr:alpha/beta fold hydrolase [Solirubrobacteraceae bacterium]
MSDFRETPQCSPGTLLAKPRPIGATDADTDHRHTGRDATPRAQLPFARHTLRSMALPRPKGQRSGTDCRHGARTVRYPPGRTWPFAQRFAEAGIAALLFDHRGFGDSAGEPDLFHPRRQLEDWAAAIAFARSLAGVDPDRVATLGSSMGAGNALAAAAVAVDRGIAAVVSQVPFLDVVTQAHRSSLGVSLLIFSAALRGRHVRAIGRPNEPAFINAPGGEGGWLHVVSIGEHSRWRDRVSSRWLLGRPYRPIRHARGLHCPWLFCVGEGDRVARPGPAIRAARADPLGELRTHSTSTTGSSTSW